MRTRRRRSCGSTGPPTIISPLATTSPSCTKRRLSWAIRYSGSRRGADGHGVVGSGDAHVLGGRVEELRRGTLAFGRGRGAALGVDDHEGGEARDVVDLLGGGRALRGVLELHRARILRDDRTM